MKPTFTPDCARSRDLARAFRISRAIRFSKSEVDPRPSLAETADGESSLRMGWKSNAICSGELGSLQHRQYMRLDRPCQPHRQIAQPAVIKWISESSENPSCRSACRRVPWATATSGTRSRVFLRVPPQFTAGRAGSRSRHTPRDRCTATKSATQRPSWQRDHPQHPPPKLEHEG